MSQPDLLHVLNHPIQTVVALVAVAVVAAAVPTRLLVATETAGAASTLERWSQFSPFKLTALFLASPGPQPSVALVSLRPRIGPCHMA